MVIPLILRERRSDFGNELKKYMSPNNIGFEKNLRDDQSVMLASERLRVDEKSPFR